MSQDGLTQPLVTAGGCKSTYLICSLYSRRWKWGEELKQIPAWLRRASPGTRPDFCPETPAEEAVPRESSAGKTPTGTSALMPRGWGVMAPVGSRGHGSEARQSVDTQAKGGPGLGRRERDPTRHEQRHRGRVVGSLLEPKPWKVNIVLSPGF